MAITAKFCFINWRTEAVKKKSRHIFMCFRWICSTLFLCAHPAKNDDISNFCSNFTMGVYEILWDDILKSNTIDYKIILHNYILYEGEPSYVFFPVYLEMPQILTDFHARGWDPLPIGKSVDIWIILKNAQLYLI